MTDINLAPLKVARIFAIADYGYKVEFRLAEEVLEYVSTCSTTAKDGTPLRNFSILVEFANGDEERCSYTERQRTLAWLERFVI